MKPVRSQSYQRRLKLLKDVCYCTSKENIPPVVCQTINGKSRPQNVKGFEIIFILAILEFILTTVKQITRKNDDREKDF